MNQKALCQQESKRQYWNEKLESWKVSQLSGERYCKEHQLSYSSFCYYRSRLKTTMVPKKIKSQQNPFVALELPLSKQNGYELRLPNGIKVIVSESFNPADFKNLMEVLRSC